MQIRVDDPTAPYVADLLTHHLQELQGAMAGHAFALDVTGLAAESVTFWTAWDGDTLLGFGALKQLDDAHGEVKSMRAAPAARGKGVGRAMLAYIVEEARQRGYSRLSLETGTAPLHAPAISLYRSAGFASCGAFADYRPSPHNQFLCLDLPTSSTRRQKMAEDLYVVAIITAKPDKADDLRDLLLPATQAFRREDGCKAYALHEDEKRPGRFVTYETWRDHDALVAHMKSPTMQAAEPQLKDILEREMEQYLLSTLLRL